MAHLAGQSQERGIVRLTRGARRSPTRTRCLGNSRGERGKRNPAARKAEPVDLRREMPCRLGRVQQHDGLAAQQLGERGRDRPRFGAIGDCGDDLDAVGRRQGDMLLAGDAQQTQPPARQVVDQPLQPAPAVGETTAA